ncbi:hypothetical protein [Moraxella lacunata]|uniref:hypothetical protein n=1 Tax=Moraxella lacunata TaxID=477 RepID=UPI003EDFC66C
MDRFVAVNCNFPYVMALTFGRINYPHTFISQIYHTFLTITEPIEYPAPNEQITAKSPLAMPS